MSEENKYEVDDLVNAAVAQSPIDFENAFNDIIVDKIRDAVESRKVEIAQQMYGYEPPEEFDVEENDDEFGASDTELEDSGETNG